MTTKKQVYKQLARTLIEAGENADPSDKDTLIFIGTIADSLIRFDSSYDERYELGFMHEISEWIGLKLDAPEMADDYCKKIKVAYADIFKD